MIRVELGEEVDGPGKRTGRRHGKWHWTCAEFSLSGFSRQPLLDACREIERMGAAPAASLVGLYRPGRDTADLFCAVGTGAGLTVNEGGPNFEKWKPRDPSTIPSRLIAD